MLTQTHVCLCAYFFNACTCKSETLFSHFFLKHTFCILSPIFCLMFFFWPLLCEGVARKILIIVAVSFRITGQVTTEDVQQRGQAYICRRPPSSNHSLCTAWQCQLWVLEYNLFLETKSLACIIQAVPSGKLKMATRGLEDETWSSPLCYLLWLR